MTACLYHRAPLSESQFRKWLESHPELHWVYVEGEQDIALSYTATLLNEGITPPYRAELSDRVLSPIALGNWTHGRAFGVPAELRWSLLPDGMFEVSLLTEDESLAQNWVPDAAPFDIPEKTDRRNVMLWGTRTDSQVGCWIETRIPRPLYYPVSFEKYHDQQLYLLCQDYRIESVVCLTRLVSIGGESDAIRR